MKSSRVSVSTPKLVLTVAACLLMAFPEGVSQSRAQPKRMLLGAYGFSVDPPVGWHAALYKEDGLPVFANFPWSKLEAQFTLPKGGAFINVVDWNRLPRRNGDETLLGWAHLDAVIAAPGTVISRALDVPPSAEISEAIFVSLGRATFGPDDQAQREISIYWTFRLKKFAAHLFYVAGDPKGAEYERVLRWIIFSIRPL